MQKINIFKAALICAVSSLALTSAAQAQDAAQVPTRDGEQVDEDAVDVGDIVVTGSRVASGLTSPTPLTVLPTEELQASTPSNIADALNKLPVFTGSRGQASLNNAGANFTGNFLNLRGLGIIRTLILQDGRRVAATAQDGTVDTNTLPQMLVQRVDVVTGGASAVYGSDAVTGVVNYVLDTDFNGLKIDAQVGTSAYSDNSSYKLGLAGGTPVFDERGHIEFSYETYQSDGIENKEDRAIGRRVYTTQGQGTTANPFRLVADSRFGTLSTRGVILNGPLSGQQFVADGVLGPFVRGAPSGTVGIDSGGDGTYIINSSLSAALTTHQGFARFDYDLNDATEFFVQASVSQADNYYKSAPLQFRNFTLATDNAFLPANVRAGLSSGGATSFLFSRQIAWADGLIVDANTENYTVTTGINTTIADKYDVQIFYTHGRSATQVNNVNNINNARASAALDAVASGGQVVCRVSITNPGLYPGCQPLNLFGPTAPSQAAIDYVRGTTSFEVVNTLDDFGASVTTDLFNTWAGSVRVALSGEYRTVGLENTSTNQPGVTVNCTGLRYNCSTNPLSPTQMWFGAVTADVDVSEDIGEAAIEVEVPLIADSPWADSLNLNAAARYAEYSVSGEATTWKLGLDWRVNSDLAFRGTRSRDIRAPTLNDLFQPTTTQITGYNDIHTNTTGQVQSVSRGSQILTPEIANTLTLGVILKPRFVPDLTLSLDYYDIELTDGISTVGGSSAASQAECELSNGTSPLCALYVRPLPFSDRTPANYPLFILTQPVNAATTSVRGLDAEANYDFALSDVASPLSGDMSLRLLATYQPHFETQQFASVPSIQQAGSVGTPELKLALLVRYENGPWSVGLQGKWRSEMEQSGNPNLIFLQPEVPSYGAVDFNVQHDFNTGIVAFIAVENLFNEAPPIYASPTNASNPGFAYAVAPGDSAVGRYMTVGFRARF